MRYAALAALLLLTGCASEPGWRTVEFIAIPRLSGGTCYVAKPARVVDWVAEYIRMSKECALRSIVTEVPEEMGT